MNDIKRIKRALDKQKERQQKAEEKAVKIAKRDLSHDINITEHFCKRAHERFGVRDFDDIERDKEYVGNWVMGLLEDYDDIEQSNNPDIIWVRCRQIIIVFNTETRTCITCYPITYNKVTKQYDELKTVISKKKLELDSFTSDLVKDTFQDLYYKELRVNAKELADLYAKVSELYASLSNSKHNNIVDEKQNRINQYRSIIQDLETKLQNIHNVVFDDTYGNETKES